jgi:hypothetical protein
MVFICRIIYGMIFCQIASTLNLETMELLTNYAYPDVVNEMPDKQPPATSYPEPGQQAPLNPTPDVPGTDAPEVNTGSRMDDDVPAEDIDEEQVGEIESGNP